ncbi:MAG TPA: PTS transporter subunit IIC [Spirochaetia bacterium]|nr:PTS transporter subunit IIC [Spirochaetia bacterium]
MKLLQEFLHYFFSFKAYVMLPAIILVIGLAIRMRPIDALLSALKIAVGFAGIFIIFNFFVSSIGPAVSSIVSKRGLDYPVLDVGWPPLAAITWASVIAPLTIPLVLAINLVMLATNTTRTINIDVWNYWHFALVGALLELTTHNLPLSLAATGILSIISFKMADWSAPLVRDVAGLPGISITTLSVNGLYPFGEAVDALFDRIPGLRRISWNPDRDHRGVGIIGEPMIIGVIIGIFLGLLAGYDFKAVSELSIHIAAVMFLLPHCGGLIGDGMQPFSMQLKRAIQKIFPGRTDLYVGMDSGVLMRSSSVIVTGLILMPISILLAFIVPGNKTIPLGDLANLVSVMSLIVLSVRGNVFRAVIAGIPIVVGYLLIATKLAPLFTSISSQVGAVPKEGYSGLITAFTDGGNPIRYWFYRMFLGGPWALGILVPAGLLLYLTWRRFRAYTAQASPPTAELPEPPPGAK